MPCLKWKIPKKKNLSLIADAHHDLSCHDSPQTLDAKDEEEHTNMFKAFSLTKPSDSN